MSVACRPIVAPSIRIADYGVFIRNIQTVYSPQMLYIKFMKA